MDAADQEEITPLMLEAGASVLMSFSTYFEGEERWAERVYRAMREAATGRWPEGLGKI